MKARSNVIVVLLGLLATLTLFALIGGGCAIKGYNRAIKLDESVKKSWAQVENILQSRYDLIPNLVETVKGYASHEKEIFEAVANARTKYFQAGSQSQKVEAATGFERALSRLLVLQEKYPDLKAQASFAGLMDSIEGTERRLAVERKRYNDSVGASNAYQRTFFGRMFAGWAGIEPAEYFKSVQAAATAPKVDFSPSGP